MPRVKVCGFTHEEDVAAAVNAGVDAIGAIVDVPVDTPRAVSPSKASDLFEAVPPFVSRVLVTMPDSVDDARELVEIVQPDTLQIHAGLDPEAVATLSQPGLPTIAAVDHDESAIESYATASDALLVDSTDDAGAGGTGNTHDWTTTRSIRNLDVPLILAGGLTPENVAEAVQTIDPYAVDVASGVEAEPGRKSPALINQFVKRARRAT